MPQHTESQEVISRFRLIERARFIEYGDDVELIFVELPKFTRTLEDLNSIQDKWIYFVKNAGSLEYIPDTLGSDPSITNAFNLINEAAMSREMCIRDRSRMSSRLRATSSRAFSIPSCNPTSRPS